MIRLETPRHSDFVLLLGSIPHHFSVTSNRMMVAVRLNEVLLGFEVFAAYAFTACHGL